MTPCLSTSLLGIYPHACVGNTSLNALLGACLSAKNIETDGLPCHFLSSTYRFIPEPFLLLSLLSYCAAFPLVSTPLLQVT